MKKKNNLIAMLFALSFLVFSCKKENSEISDLQKVRNNNNEKSYPVTKMDSAQAISFITKQKIQELFDLSTLYTSGNRDTEIDSVIYAQMKSYFAESDSNELKPILNQLDSFKVKTAKVGNISVKKEIIGNDTLDFAKFDVEYFDNKERLIGKFEKNAQYILKLSPVKFKKEFKFYFVDFDVKPKKDSTSTGVTK
ncbi:hypothetical protein [Kaistella jeonii]|uniref:Lipoprotein n=1 Tax=Kaistella jeonii TaxID=266749 RepID=A0A0C1FD94_9FLAO|nr:hypothetical protein [Kaistella jeonii]KIA89798.1 hypothetical protein OA86_04015 [Kaistella jeonii]SFB86080.1 hypothetical protein SAMN05421876_10386 [Kaistella jeonii]VEI96032.1 Uncharacterised protein [Kaistella jeonii]